MRTTEPRTPSVVARAAVVSTVAGAIFAGVAGVLNGADAARGAAVGGAIAVGVFAFGSAVVDAISRLMPAASLLFAMLTYVLQVLLMAMVFVGLNSSGLLDDELDRNWLGGAIIFGVFVWISVQIRLATTARIPAFEPVAGSTPRTTTEGGAR